MTTTWKGAAVALAVAAAACNQPSAVESVPIGSDVQLTRQDGALVEGKLAARDEREVKVDVGPVTRTVPRDKIADVRVVDRAKPGEPPPAAKFREYTIPEGTKLTLELVSAVNTATNRVEDPVEATLGRPVSVAGVEVLPVGAHVRGIVTSIRPAGNVKGRSSVAIAFREVAAHGETYPVDAGFAMTAPDTKKEDAMKIGIPAAGGAVVGAILGGKKGAAIGAGVGGGAGTAVVLMTPGDEIALRSGTTLSVTLDRALDVRVPVRAAARLAEGAR